MEQTRLSILPPGKTSVFYSPIEGRDVLVRSGTIAEGSCFFHSMMHAYSKEYVKMDETGRKTIVAKLRRNLASRLDKKRWEEISNGLIAKIPFQENVSIILNDFYKHVQHGRSGNSKVGRTVIREIVKNDNVVDKEIFQIITELLTLSTLEKEVLPEIYDSCSEESLETTKKHVINGIRTKLTKLLNEAGIEDAHKNFCLDKAAMLFLAVLEEAERSAFQSYIDDLGDASTSIDSFTIGLISERFNRDVYFIDAKTRMPYQIGGQDNIKGRRSIIILWIGGIHYEVVGRLLPDRKVQREFYTDDPLIKRINTFLFRPENVAIEYPSLISYLPKDHRDRINFRRNSTSREESSNSREQSDCSRESSNKSMEHEEKSKQESRPLSGRRRLY